MLPSSAAYIVLPNEGKALLCFQNKPIQAKLYRGRVWLVSDESCTNFIWVSPLPVILQPCDKNNYFFIIKMVTDYSLLHIVHSTYVLYYTLYIQYITYIPYIYTVICVQVHIHFIHKMYYIAFTFVTGNCMVG